MLEILKAYKNNKESYDLTQPKNFKIKGVDPQPQKLTFITTEKALKQYTDEYLYQAEVHFLKWAKIKLEDEVWVKNPRIRKYTFGQLIREIFGRPYDCKVDCGRLSTCHMFAHYCSKVTKSHWDNIRQKKSNTTTYCISITRLKNARPFSLRLQAEMLMKDGIMPTRYNVRMVKPLRKGQARNPKTQEHLYDLQDRGRAVYERTQNKR